MQTDLPIVRRPDVRLGAIVFAPSGLSYQDIRDGSLGELPPAIYVHTANEATDDEIYASLARWRVCR
jgi:hypothetical protein